MSEKSQHKQYIYNTNDHNSENKKNIGVDIEMNVEMDIDEWCSIMQNGPQYDDIRYDLNIQGFESYDISSSSKQES